ncbi:hypothetical protein ACWT_4235 [Actinoplanes sp. SE50]|uniref:hypothetical protein n=1 Tax=unclassified Actinoplanes TaxID=2626549 RepID=UPI00023EC493|nr:MULTISPECIES: hypothetical protein [unclassified Actinoplanes]AEV85255.1 hypothetical protein ACPL_4364 [Actinoplanes sp. SE50/110]ATO83650.1 hypothetical protein ACWT_4235 [Actinoplanes sp. SE50]SLM01058.1 hypothetical protein ACSP50_4291 [Actinoplanes sp. SE50/110]
MRADAFDAKTGDSCDSVPELTVGAPGEAPAVTFAGDGGCADFVVFPLVSGTDMR